MSTGTGIEWTDATWNPVVGCSKVSEGCRNCYAEVMSNRLAGMAVAAGASVAPGMSKGMGRKLHHLAVINTATGKWNGKVELVPEALSEPLKWRKPRRVFVCSMSDLFHKDVPFEHIDKVFAVAALCPQHTFQILTKRPERMVEYFNGRREQVMGSEPASATTAWHVWAACTEFQTSYGSPFTWAGEHLGRKHVHGFPLPNVWVGTSAENQEKYDERVAELVRCPAAVRFLSLEPLIGDIDLFTNFDAFGMAWSESNVRYEQIKAPAVHWAIVGGESGHDARGCSVKWLRSIIKQGIKASVPVFVKQLGACVFDHPRDGLFSRLKDRKGGDMSEWPEDLRVRQMPDGLKGAGGVPPAIAAASESLPAGRASVVGGGA